MYTNTLIHAAFRAYRNGEGEKTGNLLKKLEKVENTNACLVSALIRLETVKTSKHQKLIFELFKKSAKLDAAYLEVPYSRFYLGLCYQKGFGVRRNRPTAARRFRESADRGCINAMYSLGLMYRLGEGVTQNNKQALEFFEKAASAKAPNKDKNLLGEGETIQKYIRNSEAETRLWAMENLGDLFFNEKNEYGINRDIEKSRDWFYRAALDGSVYAKKQLKKLRAKFPAPPDPPSPSPPATFSPAAPPPVDINGVTLPMAIERVQHYQTAQPTNLKFLVRYLTLAEVLGGNEAGIQLKEIKDEIGAAQFNSFFLAWHSTQRIE